MSTASLPAEPIRRHVVPDHRHIARSIAAGRIVVGLALLVAPGRAGAAWIGPAGRDRATRILARTTGVRDVALGAGTLLALQRNEPARTWVLASAWADAIDALATIAALPSIGVRRALPAVVVAAAAGVAGAAVADRLD